MEKKASDYDKKEQIVKKIAKEMHMIIIQKKKGHTQK